MVVLVVAQKSIRMCSLLLLEEDLERERGDSLNSAQINYLQYFFNRKKSSLQEKEKKRDTEISNFRKMAPTGLFWINLNGLKLKKNNI